ncbi:MAG TPA: hypothetical protein PLS03_10770 [Terrimicrobiaceae bacterium]|nr:hypothetical protein [Terrimicrobiaceae bacterium]
MKPPTQIPLTLTRQELDQLLEALNDRAESWERIAESLRASRSRNTRLASQDRSTGGLLERVAWGGNSELRPGDATPQLSDDSEPEDLTDGELESRRFCMQSSLAGLTALQIAARCRKVMDKILEQAEGEIAGFEPKTVVDG